ncbi:MAG: hypothetical protein ACPGUD_10330 [Parashewanella sp.]
MAQLNLAISSDKLLNVTPYLSVYESQTKENFFGYTVLEPNGKVSVTVKAETKIRQYDIHFKHSRISGISKITDTFMGEIVAVLSSGRTREDLYTYAVDHLKYCTDNRLISWLK